ARAPVHGSLARTLAGQPAIRASERCPGRAAKSALAYLSAAQIAVRIRLFPRLPRLPACEQAHLATVIFNLCPAAKGTAQGGDEAVRVGRLEAGADPNVQDRRIHYRDLTSVVSVEFPDGVLERFPSENDPSRSPR